MVLEGHTAVKFFRILKLVMMRYLLNTAAGLVLLVLGLTLAPVQSAKAQPGAAVSFQMFYDQLAPHGQWIDDPDYGYVWAPSVGRDFRPYYSGGRWAMTEYGNTWVSDYDWGWAPFHYGRWTLNPFYGWVWIPGMEWGPAWVSWRHGGGHYGWAPLGPGINININIGGGYYAPNDWWVFIPQRYIYQPSYYSRWRGPSYNTTIINNTVIINNIHNNRYVYGPRRDHVERYSGQRVNVYDIRDSQRPTGGRLRNSSVELYRPQVRHASNSRSEAPRNVVRTRQPIREHSQEFERRNNIARGSDAGTRNARQPQTERREAVHQPATRANAGRELPVYQQGNQRSKRAAESNSASERIATQRQEAQRQQVQRQQAQREQARRDQVQRQQAERDQRQRSQAVERQRLAQDRNMQMQRQRAEQQRNVQQQRQRMEQQRSQQMQRQQMQRQQMQRQQRAAPQAPQREWRRPEPQRMERQQRPQIQRHQSAAPQQTTAAPRPSRPAPGDRRR